MAKSVKGGGGVQGMNWSGKENRLDLQNTQNVVSGTNTNVSKNRVRSDGNLRAPTMSLPGTATRVLTSTYRTAYKPGDYAAYRRTLPGYVAAIKGKKPAVPTAVVTKKAAVKPVAQVIRTTVNERPSPTRRSSTPPSKAVNARTGNTTGINTGKTTGTSARIGGLGVKTQQSSYGRQMTNALNRTNQPAGPIGRASGGGGGGGGFGGGGGRSSGGGSSRSAGDSRTGGTQRNDPAGPKRG